MFFYGAETPLLRFEIGSKSIASMINQPRVASINLFTELVICGVSDLLNWNSSSVQSEYTYCLNVNPKHSFNNFVEGRSNELARAAACQVTNNLGTAYNPLFL